MKNWKKLLLVFTLLTLPLAGTDLFAQAGKSTVTVVKGLRGIEQLTKASPHATYTLLQAQRRAAASAATSAAVKPLPSPAVSPVSAAVPAPSALAANPTVTRFVNNNKRLLYSLQTTVGIPSKTAVENLRSWGAKPFKKPRRPALRPENAFTAKDFSALHYTQGTVPRLPFAPHPHRMYRGLGLKTDGADVRNILENGLLVKDVGRNNNDRRIAYASAGGLATLKAVANERVINLTDSPASALHYAWWHADKGMLVMVSVKESLERGSIITMPKDIPADKIHEVIALLEVNGIPTWCKIETMEEGFKITPYTPGEN